MSYPPCSARGREHIHRHPLHRPRRHCCRFHSSAPRRLLGQHATLNRRRNLQRSVGSTSPSEPHGSTSRRPSDRCRLAARPPWVFNPYAQGWVAEWSNAHAWKACVQQCTEGSNPSPSATCRRQLEATTGMKSAAPRHRPTEGRPRRGGGRRPKSTFAVRAVRRVEQRETNPSPSATLPQADPIGRCVLGSNWRDKNRAAR